MFFDLSKSKETPNIIIDSSEIKEVEIQKFLGVSFDNKLSWKPHINTVISKLNSCLGATRRARPFLNKSSLLNIYHSLMRTHVDYCCTTWGSWKPRGNKVLLQRLQAVCNKFFRLIYDLERTTSVRDILKNNNILNVYQTYDFHLAQVMHNARDSCLPSPLQNLFKIGIYRPCLFSVKPPRIIQSERNISQAAPKVWNAIPSAIAQEVSFSKFKRKVKQYFLTKSS